MTTRPLRHKISDLTDGEAKAIRSLERLAKRWPDSLMLFSANGSLKVVRTGWSQHADERMTDEHVLADVTGIPNDGGDPW